MPSIAFSNFKVPQKCVGGPGLPRTLLGELKRSPDPLAEFQGRGEAGKRKQRSGNRKEWKGEEREGGKEVKKERRREWEGRREWNLPHHEILDPPLADWHDLYGGTAVQTSDVSFPPIICNKPSPRDKAPWTLLQSDSTELELSRTGRHERCYRRCKWYCSRDDKDWSITATTPDQTLSGQLRWVWIALAMNYLTIGTGYVYDVSSIVVALYEPTFKPVNSMAIKAWPDNCQFVIPCHLYNGNPSSVFERYMLSLFNRLTAGKIRVHRHYWCGLRLRSYDKTDLRPVKRSWSWSCRYGLARSCGSSHYYELSVLSTVWSSTRITIDPQCIVVCCIA